MDTAALLMLLVGIYLVDSAVKNRRPVDTAVSIIRNPNAVRSTLDSATGTGYVSTISGAVPGSADTGNSATPVGNAGESATPNSGAATAIAFARAQVGKPYIWGGNGPRGYDCSGLVKAAWKRGGYDTPRTTAGMLASAKLKSVTKAELIPGDLVFPFPGHVMLYAGNGIVIEAPGRGRNIKERKMTSFWKARRVPTNVKASI